MIKEEQKQKVLIVDDQENNVYMISRVLKKIDIDIISAENGKLGVESTKANKPDMIIMDIDMPVMNGFEACSILKEDKETKDIPIMFLTSKFSDIKDTVKGLDMGADDYLLTPFDNLELVARVKVMLRLSAAQKFLKQKNQNYMDMLSFIAHELKTPLAAIFGAAETFKNNILGVLNKEQYRFMDMIYRNAESMSEMIERYMNLSRLENGKIKPDFTNVDFYKDVFEYILSNIKILVKQNNKTLEIMENSLVDNLIVNSDRNLLVVILNNFFSNAIKYSDERGIIKYGIFKKDDKLIFEIENSSKGFSEEELVKMFEKFKRLKNATKSNKKGAGLGLYNTKQILKLMGCGLEYSSVINENIKFKIIIPLEK